MKQRRTFPLIPALLALFVLLAALTLLQGSPTALPPPPTTAPTLDITPIPTGMLLRVFPDLTALDIQAIRLQDLQSDLSFTIARGPDGVWTAPGRQGTLDSSAASAIARTFVLLPYARSINITSETNLSLYGFTGTPRLLFQLLLTDGTGHVVAIGSQTPDGAAYFALVDERDEIYMVERGPVDFLNGYIQSAPIS
ncbi:MAG: hypothetical protein ACUVSX_01855 [Aggregatilineales bacterium]